MPELVVTPFDELTGLPYPIVPIDHPYQHQSPTPNYHHHFHPSSSSELAGEGGAAVRASRGQLLPVWLHDRYHQNFGGPPLPDGNPEKFRLTLLACAGVVPPFGIDLSGRKPGVTPLDAERFKLTTAPAVLHIERGTIQRSSCFTRSKIGKFFASHVLSQDLSHVSESVIDEFVMTQRAPRRKELGHLLLAEAIVVSVDAINPIYAQMRRQGHVQPRRPEQLKDVVRKFFIKRRFEDYLDALDSRLAA